MADATKNLRVEVRCDECSGVRKLKGSALRKARARGEYRCQRCANKAALLAQRVAAAASGAVAVTAPCRHCSVLPCNRPRGLCWGCYYSPGVADLYPPTSKYARRGVTNFSGAAALGEPTRALPGTPEKVAVMEGRAAAGLSIFHPLDAKHDLDGRDTAPAVGILFIGDERAI